MRLYSFSSPSRPAGQGRRQTRTNLAFRCPAQDTEGSPLEAQRSVFRPDDDPQTLVSCTYEDEEDPCLYSPDDGSLEEGPSTCIQCPAQDTEGSPLEVLDSVTITGENGDPQTLASCTYEDEEDPCLYWPDGSLEEGPSTCLQCPAQDTEGSPLAALDSVTITGENGDTQTLASCIYEDEEDPCLYLPDGSLEEGPSTCFTADSLVPSSMAVSSSRSSDPSRTTSAISSKSSETSAATHSAPSSSKNPLAVGSPGFIGVVVAGGLVLLVIGILLGRCIHRDRSQLDMAAAPRPSTVMAQTNDPEMSHEELRTQSRRSSDNEASTIRPPVGNSRTNEPATAESQFLDSVFRPANSGSATHPVANSRTWNDSGAQESQFLSESPPPDRAPQAATAPQPRRTSGAAPRTGAAFHPVHELSSDSEPEGSTTYAGPSSHARTAQQRRSQYQPQGYPTAMGQGVQDQQEWQRHMRMWSASVASERRHSTPDSDSTTRYATPDSTAR